jgi:FAD/FMN-containing dehydrogenase
LILLRLAMQSDAAAKTYLVNAGARWVDVIRTLDPLGFSPTVMQSNNDFGVGGTYCVNAHGWPVPYGRPAQADASENPCQRRAVHTGLFNANKSPSRALGIVNHCDQTFKKDRGFALGSRGKT